MPNTSPHQQSFLVKRVNLHLPMNNKIVLYHNWECVQGEETLSGVQSKQLPIPDKLQVVTRKERL